MPEAVFVRDGDGLVATELARGPWDPNALHGGAPAALMMREFERLAVPGELVLARVTYEFLRPVPLGRLSVTAEVVRSGRRVALVEGAIAGADGNELVRARGLYVRRAGVGGSVRGGGPPGPGSGGSNDLRGDAGQLMFATDAMEIRFVSGKFWELGPATAWFCLRVPVLAGEQATALQRLAAAADFGNGISAVVPWQGHVFINPDLTIYLDREPAGEWTCLQSETRVGADGVGIAESAVYDEAGPLGRATQALLIERTTSDERP